MIAGRFELAVKELAFAYENVPFFRQWLDRAGTRPSEVRSPADWQWLPVTRKVDYRSHFPVGILAKGHSYAEPGLYRSQSSGTEGDRLITVGSPALYTQRWLTTLSINPRFSFLSTTRNLRTIRYAAPACSAVECANPNASITDRTLADRTLVLPVAHDLLATPARMLDQAAAELIDYAPHFLYVDPNHLCLLVRHLRSRGIAAPPVEGIACTYGHLSALARERIEAAFPPHTPIVEAMSMSELGWLGMQCPRGTLHLNDQAFFLELLAQGRAAQPGEVAELCVTSLGDQVLPHIRYCTGDLFRWIDRPCGCGSAFPAVTVEGRAKHCLRLAGGRFLTPRAVDDLIGSPPAIDLYQVEQASPRDIAFRYLPNERLEPGAQAGLGAALREAIGSDAQFRAESATYFPSEAGGKLFSCRVTAPAGTLS